MTITGSMIASSGESSAALMRASLDPRSLNRLKSREGHVVTYESLTDAEVADSDFGTNTTDEFFDDLFRLTSFRTDPVLSEMLVTQSLDVMVWLRSKGVKFVPNFGRQSALVNGKRRFFGRLPVEASGGGAGLVQALDKVTAAAGIKVFYSTRAKRLMQDGDRVVGVQASMNGRAVEFMANAIEFATKRLSSWQTQARPRHPPTRPPRGSVASTRATAPAARGTTSGPLRFRRRLQAGARGRANATRRRPRTTGAARSSRGRSRCG